MGREKDIAKKFSEDLDRILAGQEVQIDASTDKELREVLEFAQKMTALGAAPSVEFQSRLKASLLQKLAEWEALKKEKKGSFWSIFRSHPVWQGAVAALLAIIAITIVWRAGFFQPEISAPPAATTVPATTIPTVTATAAPTTTSPTQAPAPSPATLVTVEASTDKPAYQFGETVRIELAMKNVSQSVLTLEELPPILSLMQAETGQPVYTFTAGKDTRTLAPDEVATFAYTWNQVDFKGKSVTGSYYVELEDLEYRGWPLQLKLSEPVRFEILPGAEKETGTRTFGSPNDYSGITDSLVTVMSWSLFISDTGVTMKVINSPPPDYLVTKTATGYQANKSYSATAVYSLDGNWIEEAGSSKVEYLSTGMTHTWFIPVIVPPEASELYLEITGIGNWPGSWPLTIPLR